MQQALEAVEEFRIVHNKLTKKLSIDGRSQSCILNYLRQVSKLVLYYKKSPLNVTLDELENYLYYLKVNENYSLSSFKHLIYGLKHIYRIFNFPELKASLPIIKNNKRLPVVLSQAEIKKLICAPSYFKHRVLLGLIYDGGLRRSELVNLKLRDIDLERKTLHIRQSKYRNDRYVPISDIMVRGIRQYLKRYKPQVWLFNGKTNNVPMSYGGVRYAFRAALNKTNTLKKASVHTLRHSYATHLLEMGLDIVSVKNQLGHSNIQTTMVYLHISQLNPLKGFSPLSKIYSRVKLDN